MKLTMRDARLQAMRGNLDAQALKKDAPPEVKAPEPVVQREVQIQQPAVTIDTAPMAQAVMQASQMQAEVLARAMELLQPKAAKPVKFKFSITERDRMGNITTFTAEQIDG